MTFETFDQTDLWNIFRFLKHFQIFGRFSEFWKIFRLLEDFQNFGRFSGFWIIPGILTFETLFTIATNENLNSWQSLLSANWLWHWTAFAILAMFQLGKCIVQIWGENKRSKDIKEVLLSSLSSRADKKTIVWQPANRERREILTPLKLKGGVSKT